MLGIITRTHPTTSVVGHPEPVSVWWYPHTHVNRTGQAFARRAAIVRARVVSLLQSSRAMKPLIGSLMIAGCAHAVVPEASIPRTAIGTPYAHQVGYFAACASSCAEEQTNGGIRHDVILDEATLAKSTAMETCFDVIVRTHEPDDEPLPMLQFGANVDGTDVRGIVTSERVSVLDYPYTGMRPVAVVEAVAASEYIGMSVSQPTDLVFRVIERHGALCFPKAVASSVRLHLRNRQLDFGMTEGRLDMVWKLSG